MREKLKAQTKDIEEQVRAVNVLEDKYKKLSASFGVDPTGIKTITNDLLKAEKEAEILYQKYESLKQAANSEISSQGFIAPDTASKLQETLDLLNASNARADELSESLRQIGMSPEAIEKAKELSEELGAANDRLSEMQQEAQGTSDRIINLEGALNGWPGKLGEIVSTIKSGLKKSLDSASSSAYGLKKRIDNVGKSRGFDKASKSASKFLSRITGVLNRLKRMVINTFLFRVISSGLTSLRKLIGDYLMVNQQFASSLATIKGNLLTAFQPIYDAVMPALNTLMETLKEASAVAAKFISSLFGTTAEKAQENAEALYNQAKATEEVGKETKKAEKFLASFDTIEMLGKKEEESAEEKAEEAGKTKFDQDYSEIETPKWLDIIGDKIKTLMGMLEKFFKPIKDSWDKYGPDVMSSLEYALESVLDLLETIGKTFLDIWNSPVGEETLRLLYGILALIFDIIGDIANTFKKVWESGAGEKLLTNLFTLLNTILGIIYDIASAFHDAWDNYGEYVVTALFFAINSILELLISVGKAFRDAWNDNGRGQKIFETILQIIRNIFNIIGELANRLKEAWEANDNGKAIWGAILDAVQSVLSFIKGITDATLEWAQQLNLEPLISAVRKVLEQISPILDTIGDSLLEIYQSVILPMLSWLLETAAPKVLEWLGSVLQFLAEHKEILQVATQMVAAFIGAWVLTKAIAGLAQMAGSLIAIIQSLDFVKIAIMAVIAAVALLVANWSKMNDMEKTVGVIGAVVTALGALVVMIFAAQGGIAGMAVGIAAVVAGLAMVGAATSSALKRANSSSAGISGYSVGGGFRVANIPSYDLSTIPHLADGAVISPNSEFLAVLGDQRAGTNIEAPLSTIEQALENVLSRRGESGGANVEITFTGSLSQLARVLQPHIKVAGNRAGENLTSRSGGTYGQ